MLVNKTTAVSSSAILLVPYEKSHVPTYHEWMKDEEIQSATASEPLSIDEEYSMQSSWRIDHDKLTFIACLPVLEGTGQELLAGTYDAPDRMIGDVNLFLWPADEDPEGCIGELELMIAPTAMRRQGYGRAAILTFLHYIQNHLHDILAEYAAKESVSAMRLLQLKVKIGSNNEKSINLFQSIGFIKVSSSPNYFGEIELVLEGFLGKERIAGFLEKYNIKDYCELGYVLSNQLGIRD